MCFRTASKHVEPQPSPRRKRSRALLTAKPSRRRVVRRLAEGLHSGMETVPHHLSQRAEAGPGEPPDQSLVDVREPGMGEVVAQIVKVRPGSVSTDWLPGSGRVRERLVADGNPQPVQNPAVAGILVEPRSVAVITQHRKFAEQGVELQQRVTVRADVTHSGVAATRSALTCWLPSAPSE